MKRAFQPGVYNRARLSNKKKDRRHRYLHSESVAAVSTRNNYLNERKTKSVCSENEAGEISIVNMASEEVENLFETCNDDDDDTANDVNSEDSVDFEYQQEEPENFTNIYHCVLMGINWWNHLKTVYPKIPCEVNRELQNELQNVNVELLERTFGTHPHRKCLFLTKKIKNHNTYYFCNRLYFLLFA